MTLEVAVMIAIASLALGAIISCVLVAAVELLSGLTQAKANEEAE